MKKTIGFILKHADTEHVKNQEAPVELSEELFTPGLSPAVKLQRLQNMVPFVLDNSLRETTVAQLRGHSIEDKAKIMEVLAKTGIENFIVASFGDLRRVDDVFLEELQKQNHILRNYYAFSEIWEEITNGRPSYDVPTGLLKIQKYGLKNVILEINIICPKIDFQKEFPMEEFFYFLKCRLEWIKDNIDKDARVFLNVRDAGNAWADITPVTGVRFRLRRTIAYLAMLPPALRPFGMMFEEPTGTLFPWDVSEVSRGMRVAMETNGWGDGHLLVHIHKGFGLGEGAVIEALAHGCTGIWCAVAEEGAGVGHCCSLMTLTNLARLGNKHVQELYNFPKLRAAAVEVTKITTSAPPAPKQELYGPRSMDMLWDAGVMGVETDFDINEFFGVAKTVRVTTFTSKEMFCQRLEEVFGDFIREKDGVSPVWSLEIGESMRRQLHDDLNTGHKYEYQSPSGLMDLYERAGGRDYRAAMAKCVQCSNFEYVGDEHPLMRALREKFDFWDEADEFKDDNITYMNFYDGFLSKYLPCYVCNRFNVMMELLDSDHSGGISWDELSSRAKWALNQYPGERETWTLDDLLSVVFEKHLLPDAFRMARNIVKEKEKEKSEAKQSLVLTAVQRLKKKNEEKRKAADGIAVPESDGASDPLANMPLSPRKVERIAEAFGVDSSKKPLTDGFLAASSSEKGPELTQAQKFEKEVEQVQKKEERSRKEKSQTKESHFLASMMDPKAWRRTFAKTRMWRSQTKKLGKRDKSNNEKLDGHDPGMDGLYHSDSELTSSELGSPGGHSRQNTRDFSVESLPISDDKSIDEDKEIRKGTPGASDASDASDTGGKEDKSTPGLTSCDFHFNSVQLRKLRQKSTRSTASELLEKEED